MEKVAVSRTVLLVVLGPKGEILPFGAEKGIKEAPDPGNLLVPRKWMTGDLVHVQVLRELHAAKRRWLNAHQAGVEKIDLRDYEDYDL